jgi:Spy/CpxP family protein refolding chaperone
MKKLSLVVALALGGLVACSIMANAQDAQGGKKGGGKGGGRQTTEQRLEQMTADLSLTDAQKPKVKAVLEETSKKMQEIMNGDVPQDQRREKMQPIMEEQTKKMKEILTPEQQTKWQEQQRSRFSGGKGGGKGGGKKKTDQ